MTKRVVIQIRASEAEKAECDKQAAEAGQTVTEWIRSSLGMNGDTKDDMIRLRINADEKAAWIAQAKATGVSLSNWIRARCAMTGETVIQAIGEVLRERAQEAAPSTEASMPTIGPVEAVQQTTAKPRKPAKTKNAPVRCARCIRLWPNDPQMITKDCPQCASLRRGETPL